jgi:hypothetical protein
VGWSVCGFDTPASFLGRLLNQRGLPASFLGRLLNQLNSSTRCGAAAGCAVHGSGCDRWRRKTVTNAINLLEPGDNL